MKLPLSLCALVLSATTAFADADLPDSNLITPSDLPKPVLELAQKTCKQNEGLTDTAKWTIHKLTVPLYKLTAPEAFLYFVQCIPAGSNDIHFVIRMPEGDEDNVRLLNFGKDNIRVFNVQWNDETKTLTDISGVSASCAHQRTWQWIEKNNAFKLSSEEKLGCN